MNIIRWVIVLPLSFLALYLSTKFVFLIAVLVTRNDIDFDGFRVQTMIAFVNYFAFVGTGFMIAPQRKGAVLVLLSIIMLLMSIGLYLLFYKGISQGFKTIKWYSFWNNPSFVFLCRTIISVILSIGVPIYYIRDLKR